MRTAAIVILTVALVWYLTAGWRAERAARKQAEWDGFVDSIVRDEETSVVRPLADAPGFDRITNLIAANEAARADWDEPAKWGDPA